MIFTLKPGKCRGGGHSKTLEPPVTVPAADRIQIVHKSGPCTWDDGTKTINFQARENCIITVTAKKEHYKDFSKDFAINPALGTIDIGNPGTHGIVLANGVEVPGS